MQFKFNGNTVTLEQKLSIKDYINSLNIDSNGTIILLNDVILKDNQQNIFINENDCIEVLRFVCGG